jgi:hypothetical protein
MFLMEWIPYQMKYGKCYLSHNLVAVNLKGFVA